MTIKRLAPSDPKVQYLMRRARYAFLRACAAPTMRNRKPWDRAVNLYEGAITRLLGRDDWEYPYTIKYARQSLREKLSAIPIVKEDDPCQEIAL